MPIACGPGSISSARVPIRDRPGIERQSALQTRPLGVLPCLRPFKLPAGEDLRQERAVPEIHDEPIGQLLLRTGRPRRDERREERRQHEHDVVGEPEEEPHPEHPSSKNPMAILARIDNTRCRTQDAIPRPISRAGRASQYSSSDNARGSARWCPSLCANTASRCRGGSEYTAQLVTATVAPGVIGAVACGRSCSHTRYRSGSTPAAVQTAHQAGPSR
jgi:hypothetical protein